MKLTEIIEEGDRRLGRPGELVIRTQTEKEANKVFDILKRENIKGFRSASTLIATDVPERSPQGQSILKKMKDSKIRFKVLTKK